MKRSVLLLLLIMGSAPAVFAEERTTQLDAVVVTATKTEKNPEDVTQPVTVISGEQIRETGAEDVATAVEHATGVYIANYGTPGSVRSLILRGAPSAQVLVLMDGIRMNSARDGGFDLSFIPVSVEDIERFGRRGRRHQHHNKKTVQESEHGQGSRGEPRI
jgi:vitamin B12 transporter